MTILIKITIIYVVHACYHLLKIIQFFLHFWYNSLGRRHWLNRTLTLNSAMGVGLAQRVDLIGL